MKLSIRMAEQLLLHAYFYQNFEKMDFLWKGFNICQQTTTTFEMLVSLLTNRGKYILNWLIEVQVLFFQYTKDKSSLSLLP